MHSSSTRSISVDGLGVFNSQILSNYLIEQSGLSAYGTINISNAFAVTGLSYTDPNVSIYPNNVTDTFGLDAAYREGISDNVTSFFPVKRVVPKIGVTVTAGSNPDYTGVGVATGHYIEISSGTFTNEAGNTLQIKKAQGTTAAAVLCVFRLRPQTASKYYRVYISEIGCPYLVKSDTAFAVDTGNWIAQFRTNASTQIVKYSDGSTPGLDVNPYNPRASYVGNYIGCSDLIQVYNTAAPTVGQWTAGDLVINSEPLANEPFGWRCILSGTPGTWEQMVYVDVSSAISFGSTVGVAGALNASGALNVTGYSQFGTGGSLVPKVKMKKITASFTGFSTFNTAHGLTSSKIISVSVCVTNDGTTLIFPSSNTPSLYNYRITSSNIEFTNIDASINTGLCIVTIIHEE
jgi:hypothetical protein